MKEEIQKEAPSVAFQGYEKAVFEYLIKKETSKDILCLELNKLLKFSYYKTSFPCLYYNDKDIKRGDESYEVKPPIRDVQNECLLWDKLKDGNMDCMTSYHEPRLAFEKWLDLLKMQEEVISSIGFLLEAVWTKLKEDISPGIYPEFISIISHWLSFCPARILGIKAKGSLEKEKIRISLFLNNDMHKFKSISSSVNDELDGVVFRIYLRGKIIFFRL